MSSRELEFERLLLPITNEQRKNLLRVVRNPCLGRNDGQTFWMVGKIRAVIPANISYEEYQILSRDVQIIAIDQNGYQKPLTDNEAIQYFLNYTTTK